MLDSMLRAASAAFLVILSVAGAARGDDGLLRRQAAETLRKASGFFCERVATEGGYLCPPTESNISSSIWRIRAIP